MATHTINFPDGEIYAAKLKSTSGDVESDGNLSIKTNGGAVTNLTATTGGNVGINNTVPSFTLDVDGDINFTGSLYEGGSAFVSTPWTIETVPDALSYTSGNIGIGAANPASTLHVTGNTYVSSNLQVGEVANLYVDTINSRVGIGKTNPGFDLDVSGDINFTGSFYQNGSVFVSSLWTDSISATNTLYYNSSNVGIGTATADYNLHVQGAIYASGDITAFSDMRMKENILPIENALERVNQIGGYTYNKKGETVDEVGVLAQEVMKVFPQVIRGSEDTNYSVAYGNMVAILIEAIKEMKSQLDTAHGRIDELEKRLNV